MSNPLEPQHVGDGERNVGEPALPGAATQGVAGPAASGAAQLTRPAGTTTSQPVAASATTASSPPMELLRRTVAGLERQGSSTFAAGVASRMRQADPTFEVQSHGFKSFKDFLQQASAEGVVRVFRRPGASDFTVASVDPRVQDEVAGVPVVGRYLRQDLWSAFTRIEAAPSWWRRDTGQLVGPMRDEPRDEGPWIEVRPLTREELTTWMRSFVEALSDPERAASLEKALAEPTAVESFTSQVRAHQGTARKWGRFYRDHVLQHAVAWAEDSGVPLERLFRATATDRHVAATVPEERARDSSATSPGTTDYERRVRAAVASAVDRMPLAELLRLSIPAEYLIRR